MIPKSTLPLPYTSADGKALFVIDGTEGGEAAVPSRRRKKKDGDQRMFFCVVPGCGQS